jgi:hypothetical protein
MTNKTKRLKFFEICLKPCSRTYGTAPCTAAVGVTGDFKCYNSPRTCQDPANYLAGDAQVLRLAAPTADLSLEPFTFPCLSDISRRPQLLDPGEGLGVRESVTVTAFNFQHNDSGYDKYLDTRGYNTFNLGTHWGKFFARFGNLQGLECRTVDGYEGQSLAEMERRYYVMESHTGPGNNGAVSFTVKDAIKFLDGDKSQAPLPAQGFLVAAITSADTSLTLSPSGVGDLFYPASGLASIADEIVTFTRSSDVVTLTARGLRGTNADDHDVGDAFQIALTYSALSAADIIYDLLDNYTDTPSEYLDLLAWSSEIDTYIGRLYSAEIMRPTPIKTLITELIREVGLIFYTDLKLKKIVIKAMRQFIPSVSLNDDVFIAGSINAKPLTEKRVSDVWTYYGKRNPLERQEEKKNYSSIYATVANDPIVALENLPRSIHEVMSRWITVFNQPAAAAINAAIISRYQTTPMQVSFKLPSYIPLSEGQAINVQSRIFENSQGDLLPPKKFQVLSISRDDGGFSVLAEEAIFTQVAVGTERIINITEDVYNINLRDIHDSIYLPPTSGITVKMMMSSNVKIGSINNTTIPALDVGDWPAGVTVELHGDSSNYITGAGGQGNIGGVIQDFSDGSTALYLRYTASIFGDINIWGGGGGGGGGFTGTIFGFPLQGGGGAGNLIGFTPPGAEPTPATIEFGGTAQVGTNPAGDGGDAGQPGDAGGLSVGGLAGNSIDGVSYVTIIDTPDIRGPQIN